MPSRRRIGKVLAAVVAFLPLATSNAHAGARVWTSAGPVLFSYSEPERVDALAVDPSRPGTVYAATMRGGLFRTGDVGHTWRRVGPGADVTEVAVGGTGIAYAVTRSAVLRSSDGGTSWHEVLRPHPDVPFSIQVDPGDASIVYLSTVRGGPGTLDGDLLRSSDAGLTWIPIRARLGQGYVRALAIDPFDSRRLFVVAELGFFASADSGATWGSVANGLPTVDLNALAADPHSHGTIYAAGAAGIFRSRDSGATFPRIGAGLPVAWVKSVVADPLVPGRLFAAVDGHGVHVSIDGGDTWNAFGDGLRGNAGILDRSGGPLHPRRNDRGRLRLRAHERRGAARLESRPPFPPSPNRPRPALGEGCRRAPDSPRRSLWILQHPGSHVGRRRSGGRREAPRFSRERWRGRLVSWSAHGLPVRAHRHGPGVGSSPDLPGNVRRTRASGSVGPSARSLETRPANGGSLDERRPAGPPGRSARRRSGTSADGLRHWKRLRDEKHLQEHERWRHLGADRPVPSRDGARRWSVPGRLRG